MLISSPMERKVSYVQVSDNFKAVGGIVRPLVDAGLALPRGIAYDPRESRLFVADPSKRHIVSYYVEAKRCKEDPARTTTPDPMGADPASSPIRCKLDYELVAKEPVEIMQDVQAAWVALDKDGNLYYSNQERRSISRMDRALVEDIVRGDVKSGEVTVHSQQDISAIGAMAAGADDLGEESKKLAEEAQSEALETSVMELFQAKQNVMMDVPGGVSADTSDVYWANQAGGTTKGTILGGSISSDAEASSVASDASGPITKVADAAYGVAATFDSVVFSDGAQTVFGVSKYGGNATALSQGFVAARGLVWDGKSTAYVADQGANMVYAMSCGRLKENQPVHAVTSMHDPFGLAFIKSTDPIIQKVTAGLYRSAAPQGPWRLPAVLALAMVAVIEAITPAGL